MPSVKHLMHTQSDWQQGTLDGVGATAAGDLELWRPDVYGPFDADFNLVRKDDTTVAPLSGHVATLRPGEGKFGGAVAVEEGTTNLFDPAKNNPDVEVITDYVDGVQTTVYKLDATTNAGYEDFQTGSTYPADPTKTYTITWKAKWNRRPVFELRCYNPSGVHIGDATLTLVVNPDPDPTKYQYYEMRVTLPANTTQCEFFRWWYRDTDDTSIGYIARPQLEEKPFATSFVDGTRAAGVLKYDPSILNKTHGTIAVWFKLHNLNADYNALITTAIAPSPGPRLLIMRDFEGDRANKLRVWDGDGSTEDVLTSTTVLQKDVWYHFAFTWSPSGRRLYINGSLEASNARSGPIGGSELRIGSWRDGRDFLNGLLDELLILPYAASEEEIQYLYRRGIEPDGVCRGTYTTTIIDLASVGTSANGHIAWGAEVEGVVFGGSGTYTGRIAWSNNPNFPDNPPPYLPSEKYSWMVEGQIYIPVDGDYTFALDSDDASDLFIDGQLVTDFYGHHGTLGSNGAPNFNVHNRTISLTAGWHSIKVRLVQGVGGHGIAVGWKKSGDSTFSIIPAEQFQGLQYRWFHVGGLFDKVGHPLDTKTMDYYFNEPDVTAEANVSLDGGDTWLGWEPVDNGGAIPGILPGTDVSNAKLQVRLVLRSPHPFATPVVRQLSISIGSQASRDAKTVVDVGLPLSVLAPALPSIGLLRKQSNTSIEVSVGFPSSHPTPLSLQAGLSDETKSLMSIDIGGSREQLAPVLVQAGNSQQFGAKMHVSMGLVGQATAPLQVEITSLLMARLAKDGTLYITRIVAGAGEGVPPLVTYSTALATNLNADLLDGHHGSFYRDASNLNAGNLNIARMPTGGNWSLSSNLTIDSSTLVVDIANDRVGIGTSSPQEQLHVAGKIRADQGIKLSGFEIVYNPTTRSIDFNFTS